MIKGDRENRKETGDDDEGDDHVLLAAALLKFACLRCNFSAVTYVGPSSSCYLLADGSRVPFSRAHAWCADCSTIVDAELFPDPRLDARVSAFHSPTRHAPEIDNARMRWRQERRSPPRCLRCGHHRVEYFGSSNAPWLHPGCGGVLEESICAHITVAGKEQLFSVDGVPISNDEES